MAQIEAVFSFGIDPASIPAARAYAERLGYRDGIDTGIEEFCDGSVEAWFSDMVEYSSEMSASEWDYEGGAPVFWAADGMLADLEKELITAGVRVLSCEITPESLHDIERADEDIDVYEPNSRYAKFYIYDEG